MGVALASAKWVVVDPGAGPRLLGSRGGAGCGNPKPLRARRVFRCTPRLEIPAGAQALLGKPREAGAEVRAVATFDCEQLSVSVVTSPHSQINHT